MQFQRSACLFLSMTHINQIRKEFEFEIANQVLKGQSYLPDTSEASILIIHGMGEYSRRYEKNMVPFFLKQSIAVFSYDQFGHGLSDEIRGHHPGYRYLLDSIEAVLGKIQRIVPQSRVYLYGHSMGGNVAINYALRRSSSLSGLIITSPFLKLAFDPPKWKMILGKLLAQWMPKLTMNSGLDSNFLSRDPEEVKQYNDDPMIHDKISAAYSLEMMEHGQWAIDHADQLKLPVFLAHGQQDQITSCSASRQFAINAGSLVQFEMFHEAFHEIHNDLDYRVLQEKILEWLNQTNIKS